VAENTKRGDGRRVGVHQDSRHRHARGVPHHRGVCDFSRPKRYRLAFSVRLFGSHRERVVGLPRRRTHGNGRRGRGVGHHGRALGRVRRDFRCRAKTRVRGCFSVGHFTVQRTDGAGDGVFSARSRFWCSRCYPSTPR
jgi:hypothetical protein